MKILFLGPDCPQIIKFLQMDGHIIIRKETEIVLNDLVGIDYIISYGYRHIISKEIIKKIRFRGINLHISFLPWNRGADPNLWSFLEDTPKGVSIHYLDEGLDTGEIIAQREIAYLVEDTLKTTYERLKNCMIELFCAEWDRIKNGKVVCYEQKNNKGSYHRSSDKESYSYLLINGWETTVNQILKKALTHKS